MLKGTTISVDATTLETGVGRQANRAAASVFASVVGPRFRLGHQGAREQRAHVGAFGERLLGGPVP